MHCIVGSSMLLVMCGGDGVDLHSQSYDKLLLLLYFKFATDREYHGRNGTTSRREIQRLCVKLWRQLDSNPMLMTQLTCSSSSSFVSRKGSIGANGLVRSKYQIIVDDGGGGGDDKNLSPLQFSRLGESIRQ